MTIARRNRHILSGALFLAASSLGCGMTGSPSHLPPEYAAQRNVLSSQAPLEFTETQPKVTPEAMLADTANFQAEFIRPDYLAEPGSHSAIQQSSFENQPPQEGDSLEAAWAVPATNIVHRQGGSPSDRVVARYAIDLGEALQLTAGQNPQVIFARERIQESMAQLRSAEVMWVPSIRAGANYNKHEGKIQDVVGEVIDTSRGSIYTGMGAQAVGAGSPAVPGMVMNFHLRDAIFLPRIAGQRLGASQQASKAMDNDTLMETAVAYTNLLEARQIQAVAQETLGNARHLSELTISFADAGQGLAADADRAQTELSVREVEAQRAKEQARVASVRLIRLLSHDQSIELEPQEEVLAPIDLAPSDMDIQNLIATGLASRPELAETRYLVGEAIERLRREQNAPLVPSVLLGLSYGGNGGGLGSQINNFGDRMDFDAAAYWELRNFGLGERAARDEASARLRQARWDQVRVMDQIASDIAESQAQVLARREQIELAKKGITAAQDSYRRNAERITDGQGLPLETLQSIQALDQARRQYIRAVADHNRAQFQLQRALGWPIQ
ncbi:MAG: TolC family protein [Pirellulaceae bacterium]